LWKVAHNFIDIVSSGELRDILPVSIHQLSEEKHLLGRNFSQRLGRKWVIDYICHSVALALYYAQAGE
jgi:hypothetical protein